MNYMHSCPLQNAMGDVSSMIQMCKIGEESVLVHERCGA